MVLMDLDMDSMDSMGRPSTLTASTDNLEATQVSEASLEHMASKVCDIAYVVKLHKELNCVNILILNIEILLHLVG